MKKACFILGWAWIGLLSFVVVSGLLAILFTQGVNSFWRIASPWNLCQWILTGILALPGVLLVMWGKPNQH